MNLLYITLTKFNKLVGDCPELERLKSFRNKFDYIKVVCMGSGLSLNIDGISIEGFPLSYFTLHCKKIQNRFDYVMASSLNLDGLVATSLNIPSSIRCGGEYKYLNPIKNIVSKAIQKVVLSRVDNLVVNSYYLKNKLGKGDVVYNGVDLKLFKKRTKEPKFMGNGVYIGRDSDSKGLDLIKKLNTYSKYRIDCVHDMDHKDIPKKMCEYDFLILPSRSYSSESLPNVLLEAMAVGLPCIASDVAGISEILPDEALFIENDYHSVRDVLFKLQDKKFRKSLVDRGFYITSRLDINKMNKRLMEKLFK